MGGLWLSFSVHPRSSRLGDPPSTDFVIYSVDQPNRRRSAKDMSAGRPGFSDFWRTLAVFLRGSWNYLGSMALGLVRRVFWLVVVLLVLSACGGGGGTIEADIEPQDPELVAAGAELYAAACAECHGADLRGTDRGPSHLSEVYEPNHHGDGAFHVAVLAGSPEHHWDFGPMPPVEGLSEQDVDAIVAYVREQQRLEGFEPYPP